MNRKEWELSLSPGDKVWHPWCQNGMAVILEIKGSLTGTIVVVEMPETSVPSLAGKVYWFGIEYLYPHVE